MGGTHTLAHSTSEPSDSEAKNPASPEPAVTIAPDERPTPAPTGANVSFAARFFRLAARLTPPELAPGTQVGRYRVVRKLGQGGEGSVHLAQDVELDRTVALKVLPSLAGAAEHREGKALAMLRHPGIVTLYDLLAYAGAEILVTEYVDGPGTLRQCRAQLARRSTKEIAALGRDVADALQAAHYLGIKHCDVKPDNILLRQDGSPVLIDFGIARSTDSTRPEGVEGTTGYMAPEQLRGEALPERTDVYALGVTLLECLAVPHPGARARHVPRDLRAICARATEPDPARRQPNAAALRDSLQRFVEGLAVDEHPLGWLARAWRATVRNPKAAAAAMLVLGLVGVGLWMHFRQERAAMARTHAEAHQLAAQRGSWQEALDNARMALALDSRDPTALRIGIIRAYMGLGDAVAALDELEALEAEPPGEHTATLMLIRSTAGTNRLTDLARGRRRVEEALVHGGLSAAEESYARGYLAQSLPEAMRCFRAALELDPFLQEARMHLACLLLLAGDTAEGRREVDRFRALYPTGQRGDCLEALYALMCGDDARAELLLQPLENAGVIGPGAIRLLGGFLALLRSMSNDLEETIAAANPTVTLPSHSAPQAPQDQREGQVAFFVRLAAPVVAALLGKPLVPADAKGLPQFSLPPALLPLVRGLVGAAVLSIGEVTPEKTARLAEHLDRLVEQYPIGYLHMMRGTFLAMAGRYPEAEAALVDAKTTPSIVPVRLLPDMMILHWQIREHATGWPQPADVPLDAAAKAREARTALLQRVDLQQAHWSLLHAHATHFCDRADAALIAAAWRRAYPTSMQALEAAACTESQLDVGAALDAILVLDPEHAGARALRDAVLRPSQK